MLWALMKKKKKKKEEEEEKKKKKKTIKNASDPIGNRTCDHQTCSTVPQQTAQPCVQVMYPVNL